MIQGSLLDAQSYYRQVFNIDGLSAVFLQNGENDYVIELDLNSNKFIISVKYFLDQIYEFQIIAMKSFVDLSQKMILLLKELVEYVYANLY